MAMVKEALEHFAHSKPVGEMSKGGEGKLIFDRVDEQRAMFARLLGLPGLHAVTMPPVAKRSLKLTVTEPLVPVEVFDERDPGQANRREPRGAETQPHPGTSARSNWFILRPRPLTGGRMQIDLLNTHLLPLRH